MSCEEPCRVLVVEDEKDILEVTALLLESCGYRVLTARNGAEALEAAREAPPCLIILDLMMPVMNGWQFRAAQLEEPALADVPVIVITGAGAGAAPGGNLSDAAFLQKPIEMETLLDAVASVCAAPGHRESHCKPEIAPG